MERRGFLSLLGTSALGLLASAPAGASTARALTLAELVGKSTSVVVATAVAKRSSWTTIGGARRIVTDTRLKVEELVSGADPSTTELVVRTLGGVVGEIGQIVEGEAELTIGEQSMTFVTQIDPAFYGVTAMGQGHYPITADTRGRILRQNRQLPALVGNKATAVATLRGRLVSDGLALVRAVRR
ncbi:MAG TPA: hypothetical protein VNN72_28340 [Polyangiaceae bacterium]|nr:hypothetical protein [Polyangiaceae bacterium]